MKYNLTERQYHIIIETNRIQPFYKMDAAGNEYNPENPLQRNDVNFGAMRDFEDSRGIKPGNTTKAFRQVQQGSLGADIIDKLQDELTRIAQRKRAKETGGDGTVIPRNEIGDVSKSIEDKVKDGLPLELKGKSFSFGNMKVPEDVMIINLTSAVNCPAAKAGECPFTEVCYARMEESGPMANLQLRNLRNQHMYKYLSGKEILKLIETYIEQAPVRIRYIRISEDGDFPDQDTLNFCDKLAGHIKAKYGIQTAAYTHRQLDYSGVKNIIINASDYRIQNATRYFICTDRESWANLPEGMSDGSTNPGGVDTSNGVFKCHCDCRKCYFCYRTKEQNGEPEGPLTVVEELRGNEDKVNKALAVKEKGERKSDLNIPACAVEINKKKKARK